jgi:rifampicin phosphotransferase
MLGLIRGRVYYNLLSWYRLLSLLPGYAFNRAFMERMMGVRRS